MHKIIENHNHDRSEKVLKSLPRQRKLNDEEKKQVSDMMNIKANVKLVQTQLNASGDKIVLLKDIRNAKMPLSSENDMCQFVEEVKNGCAEIFCNENNELEGIFFQDDRMKAYFAAYPELLLVDATYGLNNRRMPVFLLVIMDGNGESQIVGFFITKSENYEIMVKLFAKFREQNPKHTDMKLVVTDKNFAERKACADVFPGIQMQLCIFHVMQNLNREITTQKRSINSAD